MLKKITILLFILYTFSGCDLLHDILVQKYAVGTIVYIDDGSGDYGLDGTYYEGSKSYKGKYRLENFSQYNKASYEGQSVTIDCCWIDNFSDENWKTVLEEPFNM